MNSYIVGVDTGGTFTDCVLLDEEGNIFMGKAETTPKELTVGVFNAIEDAAKKLNLSVEGLLSKTRALIQGTTIGTNILINFDGAKTGLITTKGFEDVCHIQRAGGRVAGLNPEEIRHQAVCRKPEPIVPKWLVRGVTERIDCFGKVVIPLNKEEVKQAVKELVAEGVEALAISLLWSFANQEHEKAIQDIVKEIAPDIYVQISSDVAPVIREYGRTNTVVIDTYVGPPMVKWYKDLSDKLKSRGYRYNLLTMQAWGGVMPADSMRPIGTINSGPAGGTIAAKFMAELLGYKNVVAADVGGTSFDVSVIADWKPVFAPEPLIMRYRVETPMVQIVAIGAGGGTIAWVDEATGLLNVGPLSAGSDPGPVCYQRGGTKATVTDANIVLGYLNPDYFLGGRMRLDKEAAEKSIKPLADRLGMSVLETAAGIFDIQNAHMADLLKGVVTRRGYNPKEFVLFSFGGAGATHATSYGAEVGVSKIYMFPQSSVFSAFGIATANIQQLYRRYEHLFMPADPAVMSSVYEEMETKALEDMLSMGFESKDVILERELELKFGRQVHMERITMPRKNYNDADIQDTWDRFLAYYASIYGEGAAFVDSGMDITNFIVKATVRKPAPRLVKYPLSGKDSSAAIKGKRGVYFRQKADIINTSIYDLDLLKPGNMIKGPAVIESSISTLLILPEQVAEVDEYLNVLISI